jgi:hypothetical protein
MFKNYLTYSFVVGFQRGCRALPVPFPFLDAVTRSTSRMVDQFAKSVEATSAQDELKHVAVTLICLRDTKESLQEAGVWSAELESQFIVLKKRLEQLCLQVEEKVESEKTRTSRVKSAG